MYCQANSRMVHAVRLKHPGIFKVELRPAAEHGAELTRYGLGDHGVICLRSTGEILWKHPGHDMTQEELDAGVKRVLTVLKKR